jgi:acid phosphatase
MKSWMAALAAVGLAACSTPNPYVAVSSQPANVGDAKITALKYHNSGEYERDLVAVANLAERWVVEKAPVTNRPALVLDIDETALSNWPIIVRDDFGRPIGGPCDIASDAPCGWAAWDQLGIDEPILPTLSLFKKAQNLNVEVFFITGRPESQRAATERNLKNAGYSGYKSVFMVPDGAHFASAAGFKAPVRAKIERDGYRIIANVGDQPSDLHGGYAEQSFLLPDPFYRVP